MSYLAADPINCERRVRAPGRQSESLCGRPDAPGPLLPPSPITRAKRMPVSMVAGLTRPASRLWRTPRAIPVGGPHQHGAQVLHRVPLGADLVQAGENLAMRAERASSPAALWLPGGRKLREHTLEFRFQRRVRLAQPIHHAPGPF